MDIRHLTAALTRAGLRVAVEQNEEGRARISARDVAVVSQWAREHNTVANTATVLHLIERPLDVRDVAVLAREVESIQRAADRERSIRQGRIPSGALSAREVNTLIRHGFLR